MATTTSHATNTWIKTKLSMPSSKEFGFASNSISLLKNQHNRQSLNINSSLQAPPILHFPKQSSNYQTPKNNTISHPKQENNNSSSSSTSKWNLVQKAAAMALDAVESALTKHELEHPLPKTADPRVQISGNFAPVPENPVCQSLPVTGKIPKCVQGVYVRNGANPLF